MASQVEGPKSKRKRVVWSDASEAALLELWPSKVEGLRGQRKNGHIYAEMAQELSQLGFSFSPRDVQVKLQNFTARYRKEKGAMGISGGSPSTWTQYGAVHQIIGGFKANHFTELTLDNIDEDWNSSTIPSPSTPLSAPSSPLFACAPSPGPSSEREPRRKIKKVDFREVVIEKFDRISNDIAAHLKESAANEKELIAIERNKAASLEKIATDNGNLSNAFLNYLNKQ